MQTSPTDRDAHKSCRRKWNYGSSSRMRLAKIVPGAALGLGGSVHGALARWLLYTRDEQADALHTHECLEGVECSICGVDEKDHYTYPQGPEGFSLPDEYMRLTARLLRESAELYEKQTGSVISDSEQAPLVDSVMLGRAMMENYQKFWGSPLPPGITLVAPEQEIVIDIPGTEHTREWVWNHDTGKPDHVVLDTPKFHQLKMRLDGIVKDTNARLYVLEHKTYGQRPKEIVLQTNDQFTSYTWGLTQLGLGKVAGVAYDGMWKRAIPPKGSEMKDLFTRILIKPSVAELAEYEVMLRAEVMEMANNPAIYKNRRWDGSCEWGCQFNTLCYAESRGEDINYLLKVMYTKRALEAVEVKDSD